MPLAAYLDGANTDGAAITLTCVAATEAVWPLVEAEWRKAKEACGDPEYIHMTDLMACHGIYEGWSIDDRDELVHSLAIALKGFMDHPHLHAFTCRVDLRSYERWKLVRSHPSPARLCARIVFPEIIDWFYRPENLMVCDVMDIFFDRNEQFMRHIRADWKSDKIRKQYPIWNLVRVIEEVEMKSTPAMQIADFVCWGFHRQGTYQKPEPGTYDFNNYTIAVTTSNAIRGKFTEVGEQSLANSTFREEGQALIELWNQRRLVVPNPSKEYIKFDRMMTKLLHVSHDELKAKLDNEKQDKKRTKKSASGRASRAKD